MSRACRCQIWQISRTDRQIFLLGPILSANLPRNGQLGGYYSDLPRISGRRPVADVRRLHLNIALYSTFPSCPSLGGTPWNSAQLPKTGLPGKMAIEGKAEGIRTANKGSYKGLQMKQKVYFCIIA